MGPGSDVGLGLAVSGGSGLGSALGFAVGAALGAGPCPALGPDVGADPGLADPGLGLAAPLGPPLGLVRLAPGLGVPETPGGGTETWTPPYTPRQAPPFAFGPPEPPEPVAEKLPPSPESPGGVSGGPPGSLLTPETSPPPPPAPPAGPALRRLLQGLAAIATRGGPRRPSGGTPGPRPVPPPRSPRDPFAELYQLPQSRLQDAFRKGGGLGGVTGG